MKDYIIEAIKIMGYCVKKYGLWQTTIAFILLISLPILLWKLDVIILALKA